jgi:hypothetical protein
VNWEAISAIADVLGVIIVGVTLVYLAAQVRQGNVLAKSQARLALFFIAFLRQREWEWYQFQDGIISKDVYQAYHEVIPVHIGTPRGRKWWITLGRYGFNPQFVAEVDRVLANAPPVSYLHDMRTWDK